MVSDFNKKQKKEFSANKALLIFGAVLFLSISFLLFFANFKIYLKKQELAREVDSYKRQIEEIKNKNKALEEGIVRTDDKDYIEKIAREELDMQKEGEAVVSFVVPENSPAQEKKAERWFSWISRSWNWLKNKF